MKKFLALYCASAERLAMWSTMPQEDGEKAMADWMTWQNAHLDAVVDPGDPTGKNTRLTKDGTSDAANEVCGYSVIKAESKAEALEVLKGCPHLQSNGTYVEVMEIMSMM